MGTHRPRKSADPGRPGRPPLPPEERRSVAVSVMLTETEAMYVRHAALIDGVPVAQFVRDAIVAAQEHTFRTKVRIPE